MSVGDPGTFRAGYSHIRKRDPTLRPILDAQGLIEFRPEGDPFEALVESILSQQLAWSAAAAIIGRVRALFPRGELRAQRMHRIEGRRLRSAGVSPQKLSYLKDLSARVVGGRLDLAKLGGMSDDQIIEVLDEVKGIGRWTVQMFLIFTLGRPDVLPVDDYGIRTSMKRVYGLDELPGRREMELIAERWRPYSTVASLYLWRSKDGAQLPRTGARGGDPT